MGQMFLFPVFSIQDDKLILDAPTTKPQVKSKRQRRDTADDSLELRVNKTSSF